MWTRVFFALCAVVPGLCAIVALRQGDVRGLIVTLLFGLLVASLCSLENRALLDSQRHEVILHFRWTFWRSIRRVPLASIAQVYIRAIGKGGREVGLALHGGSELPLCQPMGCASDKLRFAGQIARQLGAPLAQIPLSNEPATNAQRVAMNLIFHAFAAVWGFVAWVAATEPASDGQMAWPAVWLCGAVSALVLTACYYHTIREIRRRKKS